MNILLQSKLIDKARKYFQEQSAPSATPLAPIVNPSIRNLILRDKDLNPPMQKAPHIAAYNRNVEVFSSGMVFDDLVFIPTTKTEQQILEHSGFDLNKSDTLSKTFLIKDKNNNKVRGAVHIYSAPLEDDELEDDDDDEFDKLYSDEDDLEDDDDNDEDSFLNQQPRQTIIKYFDVDPSGMNAEKAISSYLTSPHGYSIQMNKFKVMRQPVNVNYIKQFI